MNPLSGLGYFLTGLRLLTAPGVKRYVIMPFMINCLLFAAVIWFGFGQVSVWINGLLANLPDWLHWLSWILYVVFGLLCLLVVFFCFSLLANIIAAPFNDLLCAAVAKQVAGTAIFDSAQQPPFVQQILPAMRDEVRKLFYFAKWSIPFLILLLIPGLNVIGSVLWFLFSAWMLNLEYLEYPMSQHDPDFKRFVGQIRQHKVLSLSYGSVVSAATLVPVLNFLVMPAAVAGATVIWLNHYRDQQATNSVLSDKTGKNS